MVFCPQQVTTEDTRAEPAAFNNNDFLNRTVFLSRALHMTPLPSSSSAVDSSMDYTSNTTITSNPNKRKNNNGGRSRSREIPDEEDASEVWSSFRDGFRQVQSVLDRNRVLIQQVNENHQSRIPDNMVKNVALIQELNGNISKVVSLYSGMSSNFSTAVHDRSKNGGGE